MVAERRWLRRCSLRFASCFGLSLVSFLLAVSFRERSWFMFKYEKSGVKPGSLLLLKRAVHASHTAVTFIMFDMPELRIDSVISDETFYHKNKCLICCEQLYKLTCHFIRYTCLTAYECKCLIITNLVHLRMKTW